MAKGKKSELNKAIEVAVHGVDDTAAWDAVEGMAAELDSPDEVLAAYKRVLAGAMDAERAEALGQRAGRFHEEWFGQDPAGLSAILGRVLELAPRSEWAFQQLTVVLTVAEKWDDLLALYDTQLAATKDRSKQEKLLDEAYQIAKDLAANSPKAMAYLHRLYGLTRDQKQASALERLLEKHESWRDLISFWEQRIDHVPTAERPQLRLRIARIWFDNLNDPAKALDTVRLLLAEPGRETADQGASELLERLATSKQAAPAVREGALDLLRGHHEAAGRADDIVRVVEAALPLADVQGQIDLHRDAAKRLAELGKHDAAIEHYAELLKLDPSSIGAQRALRQVAQVAERLDRYADAAAAAAERSTDPARKVALLNDAARARLDLEDEPGAIDLFKQALGQSGIPRGDIITVGRRLDELLARAGRGSERLSVLEKLASAESVPSSQKALIGDVARLAEELGDVDRALAAWRRRLENDAGDMTALGALIDLLEKEERWQDLVTALEQRVDKASRPGQKRTDLIRVARIHERELSDPEQAIAAWLRVRDEIDGQVRAADVVAALTALYTTTGKWRELGALLEESSGQESVLIVDQLVRLGDAHRQHLGSPERALAYYRRALDIDSKNEGARQGLLPLLDLDATRSGAASALGHAYRANEDWTSYLALVEARLAGAEDDEERLRILREAAAIHERIGDPDSALAALARAFPLAPKDRALSDQLVRLARAQGRFDEALEGFRKAAEALTDDAHAAAQLRLREGELLQELNDLPGAHTAYFAVLSVDPGNLAATQAVVRIGSRLGRWVEVAAAICDCIRTRGRIEEPLLSEIDEAAGETGTYDEMCRVLTAAPLPEAMPELFSEPIAIHPDPVLDPDPDPHPDPDPDPDPGAEPHPAAEPHPGAEPATASSAETARPKKPDKDPALPEKNLAALEALCADMERLVADAHVKLKTAEKKLQQADNKLPSLAILPPGQKRKALERFQEARRHLFIKVGELREAEEWKRWANVPKQEELIALAEAVAASPDAGPMPTMLKQLQDAWKQVGPAPKEKAQDLWQRFKAASDKVYERVVQHRHEVAGEHKDNLKKKQELCVRAEELAESTDWGPAAEALKRLQAEWKTIGPVPRKQADEVWKRFRAACDRFFERRRPILEKTLGERQANLEAKQSLVERAEALAAQADEADWEGAIRQVGFLRREWREVGPVPQRDFEVLSRRFFDACDRVYGRRDEAKQNLLARRLNEVTEPFAAAEALVAAAGEGQEIDGAALAENVIKARAALREFESSGASLGDEVRERMAALCRRAVEVAPAAFKGSDLDPEQSRKRKERLLGKVEELAAKAAAAPAAPTTPQEMAARLKAALADRALGGVLAKETRPIREQVSEAREAWRKLGPVPGEAGEELERRFEDACRRASGTG